MRQILRYTMGLLALLLVLPACKRSNDIEEPTLDLSKNTLTFAKDASEQSVTVQTNKDSWTAFVTQGDWLALTQEGTTLKVKAQANNQGTERTASVVVNAGGLQRVIAVKQTSGSVILEPDRALVEIPAEGKTEKVYFETNANQVKVALGAEADWLTLTQGRNSFTVTVKANEKSSKRSAKVILTAGTATKEVEIRQAGKEFYVLPLLDFPSDLTKICDYEQGRNHILIKTPDGFINKNYYRFLTKSPVMTFIQYYFETENSKGFTGASSVCFDTKLVQNNAEFDAFLADNGFTDKKASDDGKEVVYTSKKLPLVVTVTFQGNGAIIDTEYKPNGQDKDYPTFKVLPMTNQTKHMGDREMAIKGTKPKGKKKEEIRKIEKEEYGGVLSSEVNQENYDRFEANKNFEGESYRGYFYLVPSKSIPADDEYIGMIEGTQALYPNTTLGYWTDILGRYSLTKEAKALFEGKGFKFWKKLSNGYDAFLDKPNNQAYLMRVVPSFKGKPTIELQSSYEDLSGINLGMPKGGVSVETLADYKAFLKAKAREDAAAHRLMVRAARGHELLVKKGLVR
ncbi:BACON domain-containing carbohydrate-binding protein [uncultured Porphyromonas sp.]|jgi:putative lipoprotein|uniref:BACON domain-containing protein n=1 Tax=uncultured Porphyromonas sp. TaxID=159274 RepID=UPI00261F38F8|nr:BACON domain-containing carbohydrate-binding protein [uncultured Porphyromonas sp.]